ncbi:MAG: transglycosylase SLT domain-containing protein [bacterium]
MPPRARQVCPFRLRPAAVGRGRQGISDEVTTGASRRRRGGIFLGFALLLLCRSCVAPLPAQDRDPQCGDATLGTDPKDLFRAGVTAFQKGRFADAADRIGASLRNPTGWEEYAHFYLLLSHWKEGSASDAIRLCAEFRARRPESHLLDRVEVIEAKALNQSAAYGPAVQACLAFLDRRDRPELRLLLADARASQGDLPAALEDYREIRKRWPTSGEAREAKAKAREILNRRPDLMKAREAAFLREEAGICLRERAYAEGLSLYQELLRLPLPPEVEREARWGEIQALLRIGQIEKAQGVLNVLRERHPASEEAIKGMLAVGRSLWNKDQNAGAVSILQQLLEQYTDTDEAMQASYILGRLLFERGDLGGALLQFRRTRFLFPNGSIEGEAAWWEGWCHYLQGDHVACAEHLRACIDGHVWGPEVSRARYWEARCLEKAGRREEALALYGELRIRHPESYYSVLAEKRIGGGPLVLSPAASDLTALSEQDFLRLQSSCCRLPDPIVPVLLEVGLPEEAAARLDWLRTRSEAIQSPLDAWIEAYARVGACGTAMRIARESGILDRLLSEYAAGTADGQARASLQNLFPVAYWDVVLGRARENGLDPFLVLGLIHQESRFAADAASPAGAIGLMQIMPATGGRVAREIGLKDFSQARLCDPGVNVNIGTAYLSGLVRRYQGAWPKILAAYNAGPDAVKKWIDSMPSAAPDEFIEGITYSETRIYVKKVFFNWSLYSRLYRSRPEERVVQTAAPGKLEDSEL